MAPGVLSQFHCVLKTYVPVYGQASCAVTGLGGSRQTSPPPPPLPPRLAPSGCRATPQSHMGVKWRLEATAAEWRFGLKASCGVAVRKDIGRNFQFTSGILAKLPVRICRCVIFASFPAMEMKPSPQIGRCARKHIRRLNTTATEGYPREAARYSHRSTTARIGPRSTSRRLLRQWNPPSPSGGLGGV